MGWMRSWVVPSCLALLSCGKDVQIAALPPTAASGSASPRLAGRELPPSVFPLAGIDPELPSADLAPLGAMIGDRWLVGIGESVHTSAGFYRMKARLMRYLVEEKGFRILAMETPWGEALRATKFLRTCEGPAEDALGGVSPVFRDQSLASFFAWACSFNAKHARDPIEVWGFDEQQPWFDVRELEALAQSARPEGKRWMTGQLKDCNGAKAKGSGVAAGKAYYDSADGEMYRSDAPYPQARYDACQAGLGRVRAWLETSAPGIEHSTSSERLAFGRIALTSFATLQEQVRHGARAISASESARDTGMASIFVALRSLSFPSAKVMVWAHNDHLAAAPEKLVDPGNVGCVFGQRLRALYGDAYFPVALVGYHVKTNWGRMKFPDPEPKSEPRDVEQTLHELGVPVSLLDPRSASGSAFLKSKSLTRLSNLEAIEGAGVGDQFGAVIYLENSPAMEKVEVADAPPPGTSQ